MNGLDSWIEGDNYCTYCGQRFPCNCEPDEDLLGERYDDMPCAPDGEEL